MILTCPGCNARFVIPRSEDELRDMEVTHPACGHAFAPFAQASVQTVEVAPPEPRIEARAEKATASTALVVFQESSFEVEAKTWVEDNICDDHLFDDEDEATAQIDTHLLRQELTQATTIPFRHLIPRLAAAGFASAAVAELVFLFDNGLGAALPAAHFNLALLGMGR